MSKRYDICAPREGSQGKTFWTRIGTAFEGDKGIQLVFDALPLPDSKGRVVANLFEPREKTNSGTMQQRGSVGDSQDFDRVPADLDPPF